jgi:hypothetical protein
LTRAFASNIQTIVKHISGEELAAMCFNCSRCEKRKWIGGTNRRDKRNRELKVFKGMNLSWRSIGKNMY